MNLTQNTTPSMHELADLREASTVNTMLPAIEAAVGKMSDTVKHRAFAAIQKAELTPEMAVSYWMELYSNERLLKNLRTKAALANNSIERKP